MTVSTLPRLQELSAAAVETAMRAPEIVLIDVREPQEFGAERIPGALLFSLSTFDPAALRPPDGCTVVFHCGSGRRSAAAIGRRRERALAHTALMAGGIQAWTAAGLPRVTLDPASGGIVGRR